MNIIPDFNNVGDLDYLELEGILGILLIIKDGQNFRLRWKYIHFRRDV